MAKKFLTDEQVEKEIEELKKSDEVKLAKKYQQIQYRRRQYLYQLRCMKKEGIKLKEAGITMDMLESEDFDVNTIDC